MTEPHAKGFDASHWNADSTFENALDWADFAAVKVTEGTGYTDPEFNDTDDHRWTTLGTKIASGVMVCRVAYAFLNGSNGTVEADYALAKVGAMGDADLLAADFEANAATGSELIACVKRWHGQLGRKQLVYGGAKLRALSSGDRAEVAKYADLWLADWDAPYVTIDPWADWTFLQYVGIGLDLDEFDGTRSALATYLGAAAPPPKKKKEGDVSQKDVRDAFGLGEDAMEGAGQVLAGVWDWARGRDTVKDPIQDDVRKKSYDLAKKLDEA